MIRVAATTAVVARGSVGVEPYPVGMEGVMAVGVASVGKEVNSVASGGVEVVVVVTVGGDWAAGCWVAVFEAVVTAAVAKEAAA